MFLKDLNSEKLRELEITPQVIIYWAKQSLWLDREFGLPAIIDYLKLFIMRLILFGIVTVVVAIPLALAGSIIGLISREIIQASGAMGGFVIGASSLGLYMLYVEYVKRGIVEDFGGSEKMEEQIAIDIRAILRFVAGAAIAGVAAGAIEVQNPLFGVAAGLLAAVSGLIMVSLPGVVRDQLRIIRDLFRRSNRC